MPYTNFVAISPGIPTSFVPRQPVSPTPTRPQRTGRDYFLMGASVLAALALLLAVGTFLYSQYLKHSLATKTAQLDQATANVNQATVEDFVHLRDRLSTGKSLLTNHIMLSQFFDDLEHLTLQNVRYDNLTITVANDHTAHVVLTGTAKNFNTLAAQSNAFAGDTRIKRAIFSDIGVTDGNAVSFKLEADLDPSLVIAGATAPAAAQPAETQPTAPVVTATTTTVVSTTTAAHAASATSTATTTP